MHVCPPPCAAVQVYGLSPERLYATYFRGDPANGIPADDEAKAIWLRWELGH